LYTLEPILMIFGELYAETIRFSTSPHLATLSEKT